MRRYGGDPHWLVARYRGQCAGCQEAVKPGDRIFYYPHGKRVLVGPCAEAAARDFESCRFDEAQYRGEW